MGHHGFARGRLSVPNASGPLELLAKDLYIAFARWRYGSVAPRWEHLEVESQNRFHLLAQELAREFEPRP